MEIIFRQNFFRIVNTTTTFNKKQRKREDTKKKDILFERFHFFSERNHFFVRLKKECRFI